jgi:hypothetical protein
MAVISPTGLLGVRSPIMISWDGASSVTMQQFKLEIYAWTGAKTSRPSDPVYTIDRTSGFVDVYPNADIAPLLQDLFDQKLDKISVEEPDNLGTDSVLWMNIDYEIIYTNSVPESVIDAGTTTTALITDGYSDFLDGVNKDLGATFLVQGDERYLSGLDTYNLPVFLGDVGSDFQSDHRKIKYTGSDASTDTFTISTFVDRTSNLAEHRVVLIPAGVPNLTNFNANEGAGTFTDPDGLDWYDIEILDNSNVVQDSIRIYNQCEAKYSPVQLQYVNRNGMWDSITFFKRKDEDIAISKETYKQQVGSASSSGYTWSDNSRGLRTYNHEVRKTTTLNTGFVNEGLIDEIQDMMMSEYVIMTINRTTARSGLGFIIGQDFRAVNITTGSLRVQKHINDKTINYTLQVEFATPENAML